MFGINAYLFLLWLHLATMVGAMGGLLMMRLAFPPDRPDALRKAARWFSLLILVGLLAGLGVYWFRVSPIVKAGGSVGSSFNSIIGIKFILLLVSGACVGLSSAKARKGNRAASGRLQWAGVTALAAAAFLGVLL